MTPALLRHLRDMGLLPVLPPAPDRTVRGWVPDYPGDECPF